MGIMIEGVQIHDLKQISLPKGDLWHACKSTDEGFVGFGEVYFTQVNKGEVKGWKRHKRYQLNLVVLQGKVRFVIYDDRKGSSTYGDFAQITLSPSEYYKRLTVPAGVWMAFQGVNDGVNMLMDLIPEPHDSKEADTKELTEIIYDFNKPIV
jgi:dTDP-4-dehydrorhamnose 3,5-epimerase